MALKDKEELPDIKKVKTDPSNLHISRDEFIAKYRKEKELESRLAIEGERIKAELEGENLQEVEPEQLQTVATVVKNKGGRKPKVKVEQSVQQ